MRLGGLQQNDKRKKQLLYSIGQMLQECSMSYPSPFPLSSEQGILSMTSFQR